MNQSMSTDIKHRTSAANCRLNPGVSASGNRCLACEPDATPAPLDPSKVRIGDTVTLEGKHGTTIRGPVENVEHDRAEAVIGFSLPGLGWRYLRDGVVAQQDTGVWSLTEHQPTPEPEPAWEPGTVAVVTYMDALIGDGATLDTQAVRTVGGWVAPLLEVTDLIEDGEIESVRPLVVIDPATVDVDAVAQGLAAEMGLLPHEVESMHRDAAFGALQALGIEAS